MIDAAITGFGGGSIITAVITILVKLWDRKAEREERRDMMLQGIAKTNMEAMDRIATNTNNLWGNLSRFILLIVPQAVIVALLYVGYSQPDAVIWYGTQHEPKTISLLFGLFEYTSTPEVTWRQFSGIVLVPTIFAQAGAVMGYYLGAGIWSRR